MTEEEKEEQTIEESQQEEPLETAEEAKGEEETEETLEEEMKEAEVPPTEEEVKPPPREKVEEEIVEERFYTIPLGKAWLMPPNKRAPKAMRIIKDFLKRHMKLGARREEEEEEPEKLIISNEVNEVVWRRGIEKPPRKIRVRTAKDKDGNVTVYLAEGD